MSQSYRFCHPDQTPAPRRTAAPQSRGRDRCFRSCAWTSDRLADLGERHPHFLRRVFKLARHLRHGSQALAFGEEAGADGTGRLVRADVPRVPTGPGPDVGPGAAPGRRVRLAHGLRVERGAHCATASLCRHS